MEDVGRSRVLSGGGLSALGGVLAPSDDRFCAIVNLAEPPGIGLCNDDVGTGKKVGVEGREIREGVSRAPGAVEAESLGCSGRGPDTLVGAS